MIKRALRGRFALCVFVAAALTCVPARAQVQSLAGTTGEGIGHLITSIPGTFTGDDVAAIIGADRFYGAGFTGQDAIAANIEAGHIWDGHEALGHVSQFSHDASAFGSTTADLYDRHATWVGSHIAGRNGGTLQGDWQTGIAPDADLKSGAVASGWNGSAYALSFSFNYNSFKTPYTSYFGTADVINSSWGGTDPVAMNNFAVALDGLADEFSSTTFVNSAGNSGPASNTIGYPGSGYNSITVGALQNDGSNHYNSIATFSSRGPQDYADPVHGTISGVRAAIDITAPGTALTGAYYGGQSGGNHAGLPGSPDGPLGGPDFYSGGLQGTSFASPITAGGVALLDSASYNTPALATNPDSRDARVVKAVLLNSADKVPGWDNGQVAHTNGLGGVFTDQSLDYTYGAGALDLDRAFDQYLGAPSITQDVGGRASGPLGLVENVGWDFGRVVSGTDNVYQLGALEGGTDLTVTLTWFRDRLFDADDALVYDNAQSDLELIVRDSATGNVISESASRYNTVEHLHFALPYTSSYQLEVHFDTPVFDFVGTTSEEYGLAWWGTGSGDGAVPAPSALVGLVGLAAVGAAVALRRRKRAAA